MDTSKTQNTPQSQQQILYFKNKLANLFTFLESNNRCVYSQLEDILLRPKTGISKKRINGAKVTQESLFKYFQEIIYKYELFNKYPNFTIESGVSSELFAHLCQTIERNMYGYDANSKCFISVTEFHLKIIVRLFFIKCMNIFI